jgi:hypothetical protein
MPLIQSVLAGSAKHAALAAPHPFVCQKKKHCPFHSLAAPHPLLPKKKHALFRVSPRPPHARTPPACISHCAVFHRLVPRRCYILEFAVGRVNIDQSQTHVRPAAAIYGVCSWKGKYRSIESSPGICAAVECRQGGGCGPRRRARREGGKVAIWAPLSRVALPPAWSQVSPRQQSTAR